MRRPARGLGAGTAVRPPPEGRQPLPTAQRLKTWGLGRSPSFSPGPVREGVQAGDRGQHAAGEKRQPVLRGRLGGLPRGGDGGEQQPGSHQALLPLSGVSAGGRPRAPRLCEATAPPRGARAQRRRPAPPQPGVAKPALLPRDGEEARAGAGKEHASKCPRGKEDQGTLLNPAFDFKNLPCPLPSATLCFLAFLSGRFFTSTSSHFFPFYACSHIYHSG